MYEKQLRYVMTLAEAGSFSKAADLLDIAQPSLSQYVKKVERQLGIELFDRSGNIVRLTDGGRVYIEASRKILELERQMESQFQDITANRCGTIRVGIAAHRSVCLMPPIVRAFRKEFPGFVVTLDERPRGQLMDAAEHGEFDLCVTTLPVDDKVFIVEPLFHEEMLLAVPTESDICIKVEDASVNGKVDVKLLDGVDFAMLNEDHLMQHKLEELISTHGLHLNKTVECTSLETLMSMVSSGLGAALVPACMRNFSSENVTFFSVHQTIPLRDIVVIYRKGQYLTKAVKEFKSLMQRML